MATEDPRSKQPNSTPPQPQLPPGSANVPAGEEGHHDEFTGVFGFFRKYQKAILYSAGLFALITFSITTQMTQVVEDITRKPAEMPTMTVAGRQVRLQPEDYDFGALIARNLRALPPVLPGLGVGEGSEQDLADMLTFLRRAAIAEGFEVSMGEVDRAIEWLRDANSAASPTQLALNRGFNSLANFRMLVAEAMRIGNYVRLLSLAVDASDAAMLQQLLDGKEKITARVASYDVAKLQEQLKTAGGVSDDDFRKWMEAKSDGEKNTLGVFDSNKVSLWLGIGRFEPFDPAQWAEELKEHKPGDDQLQQVYEQHKKKRFPGEKEGEFKPFTDEAVKATVTKIAQIEEVMNKLLAKVREKQNDAAKDANKELGDAATARNEATTKIAEIKKRLVEKPDDEAIKAELTKAEGDLTAAETRVKAADEALKAKRAEFDFGAAFGELTKDKAGFEVKTLTGPFGAEELKNLDQNDLALGEWDDANHATFLQAKGDLGWAAGHTLKGWFLYQATEVVVRPMKPWDKLKPLLETAYFKEQAKKQGDDKKKVFEEALLRLAKAKIPEKVAELEGKQKAEVDKRFAEWETTNQNLLTKANTELQRLAGRETTKAFLSWTAERTRVEALLAKKDEQKTLIEKAVAKETEDAIKKDAKTKYGEVLEAAAQEAGFEMTALPAYPRELSSRPRFDKQYDKTVVFLFRGQIEKLDAGQATDVIEDVANQRWHCAVVDKVEPMTVNDLTRREFEGRRSGFEREQLQKALGQAFSLAALEKRYAIVRAQEQPSAGPGNGGK